MSKSNVLRSTSSEQSVSVPSKVPGEVMPWELTGWEARFIKRGMISRGGCGEVLLVEDRDTKEVVALKRPLADDPDWLSRFKREIEEQTRAKHHNVMPVLAHADDFRWFTMPRASYSLKDHGSGMSDDEIAALVREICYGLQHIHKLGMVHRDVKPQNILYIEDFPYGRWVVADLGLVRRPRGQTTRTHTGPGMFGTEGFVAPEVIGAPHFASSRADVFSLGRTIGWLTSGVVPVQGEPSKARGAWLTLVSKMTEPNAEDRLPDMDAVLRELVAVERLLRQERRAGWGTTDAAAAITALESAVIVAILESAVEPSNPDADPVAGVHSIARTVSGYGMAGVRAGLSHLQTRGLVALQGVQTEDGWTRGWALTEAGWAWVCSQADRLPLKVEPALPAKSDDVIPF